jgi:hypothetical protein
MGRATTSDASSKRIVRLVRAFTFVAAAILLGVVGYLAIGVLRDRAETARTTERFDPPVWAGQNIPGRCSTGGYYARDEQAIVLTIAAHCADAIPGTAVRDADGHVIGIIGQPPELPNCPTGRVCLASDLIPLALAPERIPWGHLNLVDMGAGGYRTMTPETHPLSCAEIHEGDHVEVDGREHYRAGTVIAVGPYQYTTDTMFPCMVITDIEGRSGDSGSPALIDGLPAGTTSRVIAGYLAFTPLSEGLANLGLTLCTTPDCDMAAAPAEGSSD